MRIVFMGTPDIAATSLAALLAAGHEVCAVFTREDKPVGRKQVLTAPPVKQLALQAGIPVHQPRTLKDGAAAQTLRALAPEAVVVVAYGRILPPEVLAIPRYGCINLHVSLLPKYRGAAPVQWAVINGDAMTGVTIMQMDAGVDTGDILRVAPVAICPEETAGELFERVSALGAQTLCQTLQALADGTVTPQKQREEDATQAPMLTKEMSAFTFAQDAQRLHDLIRGLNPWPMASFTYQGKRIKVLRSTVADPAPDVAVGRMPEIVPDAMPHGAPGAAANTTPDAVLDTLSETVTGPAAGMAPGTVLALKPLTVACQNGALCLQELLPEGSRPMSGAAWAVGRRLSVGDRLE